MAILSYRGQQMLVSDLTVLSVAQNCTPLDGGVSSVMGLVKRFLPFNIMTFFGKLVKFGRYRTDKNGSHYTNVHVNDALFHYLSPFYVRNINQA